MKLDAAMTGTMTIKAGLVGRGIGASRTPAMHMAEGAAQGIDYTYVLFDMDTDASPLEDVLRRAEAEGYSGLNVTFPFKVEIIAHLHSLSENARALGAVNTVVLRDGQRFGHNTDMWGFAESFRQNMSDAPIGEVLLLGAGGAGMAVGHALLSLGVKRLWVFDSDRVRTVALVDALLARFGENRAAAARTVEDIIAGCNGVVNATPVGMTKLPGCPIPKKLLRPDLWVADIVYFPLETELLAAARALGCRVLPGSGMAVFQAVRAFSLFTGQSADPNRMKAIFESLGT